MGNVPAAASSAAAALPAISLRLRRLPQSRLWEVPSAHVPGAAESGSQPLRSSGMCAGRFGRAAAGQRCLRNHPHAPRQSISQSAESASTGRVRAARSPGRRHATTATSTPRRRVPSSADRTLAPHTAMTRASAIRGRRRRGRVPCRPVRSSCRAGARTGRDPAGGAERDADADLATSLAHDIGHEAEDAECRESAPAPANAPTTDAQRRGSPSASSSLSAMTMSVGQARDRGMSPPCGGHEAPRKQTRYSGRQG